MTNSEFLNRQRWFVNLRFGQFIHFNSATEQFHSSECSDWEFGFENNNEPRKYPFNPVQWNPYKLDCRQWAKASKSLGVRFAALTAKHHEGFCLWNTETTPHSIKNATLKTDVVAEYLKAYRDEDIVAGLYFSILDLTHKIGRNKCIKEDVEFTKAQFRELLTNYGPIPFIIIDGWQASWGGPSYENMPFEEIDDFVKSIQPECLLINHSCETSLAHTDIVFYENAAGQDVENSFNGPGAGGNILTNAWFWRSTDPEMELKSAEWAKDKLRQMNDKNVYFLLNASPNNLGLIDENMCKRFFEIGKIITLPDQLDDIPSNWLYR